MSGLPGRCLAVCRTNKFRIIFSDVMQLGAAVIMIITLAVATNNPRSSFSWSKFSTPGQPPAKPHPQLHLQLHSPHTTTTAQQ